MVSLLRMAFLAGLYAYGKQTNNNSENCPEDSPPGDFVFTERSAHSRHGDRSSAEMFLTRIISLRYREVGELWLTHFSPSLIRPKQYLDASPHFPSSGCPPVTVRLSPGSCPTVLRQLSDCLPAAVRLSSGSCPDACKPEDQYTETAAD